MVLSSDVMTHVEGVVALGLARVADFDYAQEGPARRPADRWDGRPDDPQFRESAANAETPLVDAGTLGLRPRPC